MKKEKVKIAVLCLSLVCLTFLLNFKGLIPSKGERWMTIEEKYYPRDDSGFLKGISSGGEIKRDGSGCAFKFKDHRISAIYSIDCDRYADYRIGEKVKVTVHQDKVEKIRRK
ncbi:hypothetical protein [Bacillus sp. Marseille-Q1617]|uniref:hypothetical protein n=1 Tax=Bacillus sp. Marseille-Q1617 TaxID=2736887 RepID=UPI00158F2131|nr:hypothetical protein [Bacillus sp. Marseille-Q1617]